MVPFSTTAAVPPPLIGLARGCKQRFAVWHAAATSDRAPSVEVLTYSLEGLRNGPLNDLSRELRTLGKHDAAEEIDRRVKRLLDAVVFSRLMPHEHPPDEQVYAPSTHWDYVLEWARETSTWLGFIELDAVRSWNPNPCLSYPAAPATRRGRRKEIEPAIIKALGARSLPSAEKIAKAGKLKNNSTFRGVMANMQRLGTIVREPKKGYRLP